MDTSKKIFPSAKELCTINNNISCTEEDCTSVFTSQSNLSLHLVKTHGKGTLNKKEGSLQYFCPELNCVYNNQKYFIKLNALKQHYLKVHAKKSFVCSKCSKGFSTSTLQKSHSDFCGVNFYCLDCTQIYKSYETLMTHGRRKRHNILQKKQYLEPSVTVNKKSETLKDSIEPEWVAFMLIKPESFDKCCQTDIKRKSLKRQSSQTTQTGINKVKKPRSSAETQTVGNYVAKRSLKQCKASIRTQTKRIESDTKSCNTLSCHEIIEQRNSCSTQTITSLASDLLPQNNLLCSDFMQSTSEDNNLELFDSNFLNCTIETQTDLMFEDNLLTTMSADFCSNMYTQTCDDLLLTELGLNHIQTQTAQDEEDLLRSAETQTMRLNSAYNCRDFTHMETQTDAHFKQMLEEINA